MAVFQDSGRHIPPNRYPSKQRDHKAVPTWNYYQAVHLEGYLTLIDDADTVYTIPAESSRIHEAAQPHPWQLADAPQDYLQTIYNTLKYFELTIENVEAAYKLSQNQSTETHKGVLAGLAGQPGAAAQEMIRNIARFAPNHNIGRLKNMVGYTEKGE